MDQRKEPWPAAYWAGALLAAFVVWLIGFTLNSLADGPLIGKLLAMLGFTAFPFALFGLVSALIRELRARQSKTAGTAPD